MTLSFVVRAPDFAKTTVRTLLADEPLVTDARRERAEREGDRVVSVRRGNGAQTVAVEIPLGDPE